jgi:hypothetical protein
MKRQRNNQPGLFDATAAETSETEPMATDNHGQPRTFEGGSQAWIEARAAVLSKLRGISPGCAIELAKIDFEETLCHKEIEDEICFHRRNEENIQFNNAPQDKENF